MVPGVAAEQRRAALPTEPLFEAVVRLPGAQTILSPDDLERAGLHASARRCAGTGPALTALAMAVPGRDQGCTHLEPDRTTATAAGKREAHRRRSHTSFAIASGTPSRAEG